MEAHDDLGPGLHRVQAADPRQEATALAARMGAVLCSDVDDVEAEVARRRAAGPAMGPGEVAALELLARRLERAARIAERTRVRAESDVAARLADAGAALAVHPTTIRDRAAAVESTRRALADAEAALAETVDEGSVDEASVDDGGAATVPSGSPADADPVPGRGSELRTRGRRPSAGTRRHRAVGVVIGSFGLTLVLLGLRATTLWAALIPVLAASLWAIRYLRPRHDDDREGREEASSLLAEVGASTDELFGIRRAALDGRDARSLAVLRRDRALEELRVAERAWHALAGAGTDVDELDEVIRRYDPQHEDSRLLAGEVVAVRAADVVRHGLEQQWLATWRHAGSEPPPVGAAVAAVAALRSASGGAIVLVGAALDRADDVAAAAPGAAVIAVEPTPPAG